ncbi:MAG TPA: hypothetical protein VFQ53_38085 [Kofleriaceae bacterium]|nr:hypothetical protein [Kofleriaceae bacterium]
MKRIGLLLAVALGGGFGCEASVQSRPAYATYQTAPAHQHQPARFAERWVTLGDRLSADDHRQFINLLGRGEFRAIRVEAVRGAPVINQVAIEFSDGQTQVVKMNSRIPPGAGQTIDLNGGARQINRIIVYSEPGYGGAYSVFGT